MKQRFEIDRDDFLEVTNIDSITTVKFIHYNQHNVPILMDKMSVSLDDIVMACRGLPNTRKFVYQVRYCYVNKVGSFDSGESVGLEIERVICNSHKVYSSYESAINRAIELNNMLRKNFTWFEKLLIKLGCKRPLRYRWIASPIELEDLCT